MMELTKNVIKNCDKENLDLNDYLIVIKEIEDNINENNDITVEACKSLIEGILLKSLSLLDSTFKGKKQNKLKGDFKQLKIEAFNILFKDDEAKFLISPLVEQITEIPRLNNIISKSIKKSKHLLIDSVSGLVRFRNEKGDISHGKIYPKDLLPKHLVRSIVGITDAVCSYIIIELSNKYKIELEKDPLSDYRKNSYYNEWLNQTYGSNFPIAKARYSRVLFDNDFDMYKEIYYDDYPNRAILGSNEKEKLANIIFGVLKFKEKNPKIRIKRKVEFVEQKARESYVADGYVVEGYVKKTDINIDNNLEKLNQFVVENNLNLEKVKVLIDEKISINKEPLRDEILQILNAKISLSERGKVFNDLKIKIDEFIKTLE